MPKSGKRGQNEGSIYKRDDGRWAAVINLGYQNDKLKRKTFYGKTRKEVQEKLTAALRDQQQGLSIITDRQTVEEFLNHWLTNCAQQSVRARTYQDYSEIARLHIIPRIGSLQLQKLAPQHVQKMMNELSESGLGPRRVIYSRTVLHCALSRAVKWGLVARNVATLVDPPQYVRPEIKPLSLDEIQIFLGSVSEHRLCALYHVAINLGLRMGEILGLRWEDIDYGAHTLTVRYALQRLNGKLQLVEPKTVRSRRTLPLSESVISVLKAHKKKQLSEKIAAGNEWKDTGMVFTTSIGTPLEPTSLLHRFQELLAKAGLPKKRFHDLRHSCATLLLSQGVPARTVMEILGHSSISLTMNTYSHVMPEMLHDAAQIIDGLLNGKSSQKTQKVKK